MRDIVEMKWDFPPKYWKEIQKVDHPKTAISPSLWMQQRNCIVSVLWNNPSSSVSLIHSSINQWYNFGHGSSLHIHMSHKLDALKSCSNLTFYILTCPVRHCQSSCLLPVSALHSFNLEQCKIHAACRKDWLDHSRCNWSPGWAWC